MIMLAICMTIGVLGTVGYIGCGLIVQTVNQIF